METSIRAEHRGHADRRRGHCLQDGIVIAQVNEIVDKVPRVDITRETACSSSSRRANRSSSNRCSRAIRPTITETQILTAMLAIKGVYAPYGVRRLNMGFWLQHHAAIELLLPTYGENLGLKGKVATHFALNPHPALIPAIESGWVEQIHSFGSEVGMDEYIPC